MPTDRMLPDTVTIFNRYGEDGNGNALYHTCVIQRVYARMKQGIAIGRGETGVTLNPADELIVYVFDQKSSSAKPYMPFKEWDASNAKAGYWTVHDDGSDLAVIGTATPTAQGAPPDNAQTFKAAKIIRRQAGKPRMWHWEVHCV